MIGTYGRPSSAGARWPRISLVEVVWVALAGVIAFWLRDPEHLSHANLPATLNYALVAMLIAPPVFAYMRTSQGLSRYFSVHDAIAVLAACFVVAAVAALANFTLARLETAPRSVPVLHFFVMAFGSIAARALARVRESRNVASASGDGGVEYILLIGATRLAWFYLRMMEGLAPRSRRVVGLLDERDSRVGRAIGECQVVGMPADIGKIVAEYKVHGLEIHRIVVALPIEQLSEKGRVALNQAGRSGIEIQLLDRQILMPRSHAKPQIMFADDPDIVAERRRLERRPYWLVKRAIDIVVAGSLLAPLLPVVCLMYVVTVAHLGLPAMFWQRRIGRNGQAIVVSKFRTLRAPFDRAGRPVPEERRLSPVGRLVRASRLDEIPQLFSILKGDMSLIGPRPLLPVDQPREVGLRLMVAPGLTGWAQVNGGKLISIDEKNALDEWYVRHASLWLDLRIIVRTPLMMVLGDRRGEQALAVAFAEAENLRARRTAPMPDVPQQSSNRDVRHVA